MSDGRTAMEPQPLAAATKAVPPTAATMALPPVDVAVIVVTWNSERWIERCLRSIRPACDGLTFRVVLYDNASDDRTLEVVESVREREFDSDDGRMIVLRGSKNIGFAAATNRALDRVAGEFVFLLNPDCELDRGAVRVLCEFFREHPEAAAAAPLLVDESGESQREFQLRRFPTLQSLAWDVFALDRAMPAGGSRYRYRDLDLTVPQRVDQPAAAALMIRWATIQEVGPFDERFEPAWFEDVDYCRRMHEAGKVVFVVPAAGARHFGGSSLETLSFGEFTDFWYRNMWRYAVKWLPRGQRETLRWFIIVAMMLRSIAALAGIKRSAAGRYETFLAYRGVMEKAFRRWSPR